MKIIITGKTGYISNNLSRFLNSKGHIAETISVRNGADNIDFKDIDAVIHCAAIVHKKESDYADKYEAINHRLTINIAKKAKSQGVKHFVFMSSMSVYGNNVTEITMDTPLCPATLYGKTKLMAERDLQKLRDKNFTVTIIRPPMVYGKGCPGNYTRLSRLAKKLPVFPYTDNKKSMIYIDNLSYIVADIIENQIKGIILPMDNKYVSTSDMATAVNKNIRLSKSMGAMLKLFKNISIVKKAFGTLYYAENCATKANYIEFEKAIELTES